MPHVWIKVPLYVTLLLWPLWPKRATLRASDVLVTVCHPILRIVLVAVATMVVPSLVSLAMHGFLSLCSWTSYTILLCQASGSMICLTRDVPGHYAVSNHTPTYWGGWPKWLFKTFKVCRTKNLRGYSSLPRFDPGDIFWKKNLRGYSSLRRFIPPVMFYLVFWKYIRKEDLMFLI